MAPRIEVLPCHLSAVLFETNPDNISVVAQRATERIDKLRRTRADDRKIAWLEGLPEQNGVTELSEDEDRHYRPRVYVLSGTFDLAAFFLSPSLEMAPWLQTEGLLSAGHDINVGLLPTAASLFPGEGVEDFNVQFQESFVETNCSRGLHWKRPRLLPVTMTFASISKIKLNPLVMWREHDPSDSQEPLLSILRELWRGIVDWREQVHRQFGNKPQVALCLSFGWNELLVVAHASVAEPLLELSLRLRQGHRKPKYDVQSTPITGVSHDALTTVTHLGFDAGLRLRAETALDSDTGPTVSAERLVEIAEGIDRRRDALRLAKVHHPAGPKLMMQVGCHTYPGHELSLLRQLHGLEEALPDRDATTSICIDLGKRDVWTPHIPLKVPGWSPGSAVALVSLVQMWIRNGGSASRAERIPAAFDFYMRVGWLSRPRPSGDELEERWAALGLVDVPSDHVQGLARERLTPPVVERALRLEARPDEALLDRLRKAMRTLQLPYPLAEQVLNVVNVFYWSNNREVIWDESIELVPPILALCSYLEHVVESWDEGLATYRGMHSLPERWQQPELLSKLRRSEITTGLLDPPSELQELLGAFRANFYTTQFSNYLFGEIPDLNLRFKGSLHQLLRMSNMVFDALVDLVLGPRACLAIIQDVSSPQVDIHCDIPIVQLNSSTFTMPVVLESLAHEVSHLFLADLGRWRRIQALGISPEHSWATDAHVPEQRRVRLDAVRRSFDQLDQDIFLGGLSSQELDENTNRFVESTADFMELTLLGRDFREWLRSFTLRTVFNTPASVIGTSDDGSPESRVPVHDEDYLLSAIIRAALVKVFLRLEKDFGESWFLGGEIDIESYKVDLFQEELEPLRKELDEIAILGIPSAQIEGLLDDPDTWFDYMSVQVLNLPWLVDRLAMSSVSTFHAAVVAYLDDEFSASYRGSGRLWTPLRKAFAELWAPVAATNGERIGVSELLANAVFVQHWLSASEKGASRAGENPDSARAVRQPRARQRDDPGADVDVFIFQRGTIRPFSRRARAIWDHQIQSFLARLVQLLPAWHCCLLDEIERIHSGDSA